MVAILMSTYNGEKYLKEQIDSILSQTYRDFVLFVRDDGSNDSTVKIIKSYDDSRIIFECGENKGPAGSFFALLNKAKDYEYVFFSDQDDVWYPEKLEKMLTEIKKYGQVPTMVFSDFAMIDSNGYITAPSYSDYASLQVEEGNVEINKIIAQPYVFGCASVINRALSELVLNPPSQIEMHDCWISLVAAATGNLIYMPYKAISHRFHNNNATGKSGQDSFSARFFRITKGFFAQAENTQKRLYQVFLLLNEFENKITPKSLETLNSLSSAMKKGKFSTIKALRKNGISRQRKINTLFFYMTVFAIKGEIL